jgi:integrase/recombinase XerC
VQFDPFLTYLATERRYSPHTADAYRRDLQDFSAYLNETYEAGSPGDITRQMVRSWLAGLMEKGYRETSVHRKLSAVNAWFRFLVKNGQVAGNPARGIPRPKLPGRLPVFLDERGTEHFYPGTPLPEDYDDARDQLVLQVFYETGMRLSELIGIRDRDIDFSASQVRVTGKRNKTRLIPVSADMLLNFRAFTALRDRQITEVKEDAFFVTNKGKKLTRSFVYLRVKKYLSAITTLKKRSPHVLRHTFATHMLNNGAELNVIKEILGHSSLAATQVYTHLSVEKLRKIHGQAHPRS